MLVIIAGLAAISLGVFSSVTRGASITAGAQMINDLLTEAREDAVSENSTVEVRFYQVATIQNPTPAYRAVQLHWLKPDLTTPGIRTVAYLPGTAVIDPSAAHSSLIGGNNLAATPDAADPNLNAQTRVFHYLADGTTDLAPGSSWFLTVRADNAAAGAPLPADWASVTVDPVTGRTQILRP